MTDRPSRSPHPLDDRTIILAGVSVRALAQSAARAGYRVIAADAFADLDLRAAAAHVTRVTPYSANGAARVLDDAEGWAACYTSNFENHVSAVGRLARGRSLLGNSPQVLTAARSPAQVARILERVGVRVPQLRHRASDPAAGSTTRRWLIKPIRSGGGRGVVPWQPGTPIPQHSLLQEQIPGTPASILFAADGEQCVILGITRQLIGRRSFGSSGYRYCGNILPGSREADWSLASALARQAHAIAAAVTAAFHLVGVNGIDVIVQRGRIIPVEINPRYTAAMELIERRDGTSIFTLHAEACGGELAAGRARPPAGVAVGKAVVFARRASVMGTMEAWLTDQDLADIPSPGTMIPKGAPICTVFATAPTARECYRRLVGKAESVYRNC